MEKKIQTKGERIKEMQEASEGEILTAQEVEAEMRFQAKLFKGENC
jgi:hypothetical protein